MPSKLILRSLLFLCPLLVLAWSQPAEAQGADRAAEARDLALAALRLEFGHDNVSANDAELDAKYKTACERGYNPACRRGAWLIEGRLSTKQAVEVYQPSCDAGDPVACVVVGWSWDRMAAASSSDDERDRLHRDAWKLFRTHCDKGFIPACHFYGASLYHNLGMEDVDPRAGLSRWSKACQAHEYASCTQLARLYRDGGDGIKRNSRSALSLAKKACSGGYADGCYLVGELSDRAWDATLIDTEYGRLCDAGHREACWRLARFYFDGVHVEPTSGRVMALFGRACELGHARACFEAGRWLQDNEGPPDGSAQLFGRACELGDSAGCGAQVDMMLSGQVHGTIRDATHAFDIACEERRSMRACTQLAAALLEGVQVPRDAARGRRLLADACTDQDSAPDACFQLGQVVEQGIGGPRDRPAGAKFYSWACTAGSVQACMRRGELLYLDGSERQRDDREALSMFQRACEGKLARGCFLGGQIVDSGTNVPKDLPLAQSQYQLGCDLGSPEACNALGALETQGVSGVPDLSAARTAYESALSLGSIEAKRGMARLLWYGLGGRRDRGRAKDLCREACQSGDALACKGPAFL